MSLIEVASTEKWKAYLTIFTVFALIAVAVPSLGSVIVTENVSTHSGYTIPYAQLTNSTSPLSAGSATVSNYGNIANISISGVWQKSTINSEESVNGFIALILNDSVMANSYVTVISFSGSSNVSKLSVSVNGSSGVPQQELKYSNGTMSSNQVPVQFTQARDLNFSISFNPSKVPSKSMATYNAYLSLLVTTYTKSGSGSVYIQEHINIALTMHVFLY